LGRGIDSEFTATAQNRDRKMRPVIRDNVSTQLMHSRQFQAQMVQIVVRIVEITARTIPAKPVVSAPVRRSNVEIFA
jgi:hypothetical protein